MKITIEEDKIIIMIKPNSNVFNQIVSDPHLNTIDIDNESTYHVEDLDFIQSCKTMDDFFEYSCEAINNECYTDEFVSFVNELSKQDIDISNIKKVYVKGEW